MGGLFVTFEGTEGSGKSTQVRLLAERLREMKHDVLALREPGGTAIGEEIRRLLKQGATGHAMFPETELLLMNASRAQLVREVIRPALEAGRIVLCDRFFDSTVAYQVYGRGLDAGQVQRIIEFATGGLVPDITFFLRVPLGLSEARRSSRASGRPECDRFEEEERPFFRRVEQGYDAIAARAGSRVRTIDATRSIETVQAEIWRDIEPLVKNLGILEKPV